jgi:hypothetical protein
VETIVQDRSPYDDIPEDLAHQPDVLDATAAELEQLTRLLEPESIEVIRGAAASETASSSARALEAEARGALRALLEDPDDGTQLGGSEDGADDEEDQENIAWRHALEQALSRDIHSSLSDEVPPWLVMRANDLARTMAVAWIGFGRSGLARAAVLDRMLDGESEESLAPVNELRRRFELSPSDTRAYLSRISRLLREANHSQALTSAYAQAFVQSHER